VYLKHASSFYIVYMLDANVLYLKIVFLDYFLIIIMMSVFLNFV